MASSADDWTIKVWDVELGRLLETLYGHTGGIANVAFRAVPLGTGRHVVELRYRPWSVPTGLALSGASIVAAAALALGGRGPAKEGRPAA